MQTGRSTSTAIPVAYRWRARSSDGSAAKPPARPRRTDVASDASHSARRRVPCHGRKRQLHDNRTQSNPIVVGGNGHPGQSREGETAAAPAEQIPEKPQVTENPSAAWGSFCSHNCHGARLRLDAEFQAGTTARRENSAPQLWERVDLRLPGNSATLFEPRGPSSPGCRTRCRAC